MKVAEQLRFLGQLRGMSRADVDREAAPLARASSASPTASATSSRTSRSATSSACS